MPYRDGANLGVARRLSKSGCRQEVSARKKVQQIKIENEMPYGSMAGCRLSEEYGKM